MKQIELLQEQSVSENTENNSNSYENQEKINEPIEHTLIIARCINEKWFGTIGSFRITKEYETYEELKDETTDTCITWEDITKVIAAQYEWLKEELNNIKRIANNKN